MSARPAVLLANLGGPEGPDDVAPFIERMLSDPLVMPLKMYWRNWSKVTTTPPAANPGVCSAKATAPARQAAASDSAKAICVFRRFIKFSLGVSATRLPTGRSESG